MDIQMNELRIVEGELGTSIDMVVGMIGDALLHAYQRTPGTVRGTRVEMNRNTGKVTVYTPEVDEEGEVIGEFDNIPGDFGHIVASTVRSVIAQRLRDVGTDRVLGSFKGKQSEVVSDVIRQNPRHGSRDLLVDIGEHEVILRVEEQVSTERFRHGDHIRTLILEASVGTRGASARLSRAHPNFAHKLFEMKVPEIQDGTVEIVTPARKAGHRTKIAVWLDIPDANTRDACVGHNGQWMHAVATELGGEKVDMVDYDGDSKAFIAASLSPTKVVHVDILDKAERRARVIVPDGWTSLAIGKEAQNVRLTAELTGWSIDIHKESDDLDAFGD